jgi:hypothetical protein
MTAPAGSGAELPMSPLDLLLKQGSPGELAAMRERVAAEPLLAIEVAETVALLEQLRQVRVEPSPVFATRLHDVVRRAELRLQRRAPAPFGRYLLLVAAAAGLTCMLLAWADPLHLRRSGDLAAVDSLSGNVPIGDSARGAAAVEPASPGEPVVVAEPVPTHVAAEFEAALQTMRRRLQIEAAPRLQAELEAGLQPAADPLSRWLDPRNALVELRIGHEWRARPEVREELLRRAGAMPGADQRVQELADSIAAGLAARLTAGTAGTTEVAQSLRALIAAGAVTPDRRSVMAQGAQWLVERASETSGNELAMALAALVEIAAIEGRYADVVVREGARFVDEMLRVDGDTWGRRLPELLTARASTAVVADAGRTLALLPGLGVGADRCALVRRLLLGQLRERLAVEQGPEALAGLLFGFADLLPDAERTEIEFQLRRWKPARLAPDFATIHHLAWAIEPGRIGYTRLQGELRRLAVLPEPTELAAMAGFCMSLATGYAAFGIPEAHRDSLGE